MKSRKIHSIYAKIKSLVGSALLSCTVYLSLLSTVSGTPSSFQDCSYERFRSETSQVYTFKSVGLEMSVPESWEVSNELTSDAIEVIVQSGGPCKITGMVTVRVLTDREEKRGDRLLDDMLNSSLNHLKSVGHEIIDVGKTDAFGPETPGFVIVSGDPFRENFATLSFAGLNEVRNVGVTIRSDAMNNRDAISNIIRDIVEAVRIN